MADIIVIMDKTALEDEEAREKHVRWQEESGEECEEGEPLFSRFVVEEVSLSPDGSLSMSAYTTAEECRYSLPVHVLRNCYRVDLMHVVQRYLLTNRRYCKLFDIAAFLDVKVEDDVNGSDIPELVRLGRWDEVEERCRRDVETTYNLFLRLQDLAIHNLSVRYNIGPLQVVEVQEP